jgi:hypothetical protein
VNFKGVTGEGLRSERNLEAIAADHGSQEVCTGMNNGNCYRWILEESLEVNSCRPQRFFIGLVADGQDVGKVHDPGSIGVLKINGTGIGKRHGARCHVGKELKRVAG